MLLTFVVVQPSVPAASSLVTLASVRIRFSVVPIWMRSAGGLRNLLSTGAKALEALRAKAAEAPA